MNKHYSAAMQTILAALSVIIVLGVSENAHAQGPTETAEAMLEVAESDNWEIFVHQYYGELHKAESEDDINELIARFRDGWGEQFKQGLRQVVKTTPTLSEDGTKAIFDLDSGNFVLHKDENGAWKFHL